MHTYRKKTPQSDAGQRSRCFEDAQLSQWSSILQCKHGGSSSFHAAPQLEWLFGFPPWLVFPLHRNTGSRLTTPNVIPPSPFPTHRNPSQYTSHKGSLPMSILSLAAELRPSCDTFVRTTRLTDSSRLAALCSTMDPIDSF